PVVAATGPLRPASFPYTHMTVCGRDYYTNGTAKGGESFRLAGWRASAAGRDAPLVLLPAKSGFAFLAEGSDPLAEIVRHVTGLLRDRLEIQRLGERVRFAVGDRPLDSGISQSRTGAQDSDPFVHDFVQFFERYNRVDQPPLRGLLRVDDGARDHPLEGFGVADHTRQKVSAATIGDQADFAEHLAEPGFRRGDTDIGRQRIVAAHTHRMSVHARDYGLGH